MTPAQAERLAAMRDGGNRGLPCRNDKATKALIRAGHAFRRHGKLYLSSAGRRVVGLPPCRAVCAWCTLDLGERPAGEPGTTTHGLCPECKAKLDAELEATT